MDLSEVMNILHYKNIESILVEGGAKTISSFLEQNLADEVFAIIAPSIMGGTTSHNFAQHLPEQPINSLLQFKNPTLFQIHDDLILNYTVKPV
jgi:diaminohydroxyphosphoribosylaminopyrimidine deaminase / 5-amino-6-(5-phosphoribosylamino)uracil reductase